MKTQFKNKRAFTLIELLIVIAIIGILFIVLVSKVDFATDKAKATGVQTDFRSFQTAFEQVARENSGYATLGWDTGDDNGDRIRNSYDKGDNGAGGGIAQNGIQDGTEVFVGSKTYGEDWTGTYTLVNPDDSKDASAFVALENAINKNLDPKLHITITPKTDASGNLTGSAAITMANQARDPWKNEYAGAYITNATVDSLDRGSIIMYSTGANGKLGVNYSVSGGLVGVEVHGNNVNGKDDYVLSVTYSYANGYGEVQTGTAGFSSNQSTLTSTPIVDNGVNAGGMSAGTGSVPGGNGGQTPSEPSEPAGPGEGGYQMLSGATVTVTKGSPVMFRSSADADKFVELKIDGQTVQSSKYHYTSGSTVVTIFGSTIDSLGKGEHEVEIVSEDGSANAILNIAYECTIDHWSIILEYDAFICPECGTFSCDASCVDSIDDGICSCDWCGTALYGIHYDGNIDGYCDTCNTVYCGYNSMGNWGSAEGICLDLNHDCYCDWCFQSTCDRYYHDVALHDLDGDNYCDTCGEHVPHYDTDDGWCDVCGVAYCVDMNIHRSENNWHYCDWCIGAVVHYDNTGDGFCDCCGELVACPGHVDYYNTGICSLCGEVCCQINGICRDLTEDGKCDSCGQPCSCSHYDENDYNGYCDWCGDAIECFFCGHMHPGEYICDLCEVNDAHQHIDMNCNDYCDCCGLCYYCNHAHYGQSRCPSCNQDGYYDNCRDDNGDGRCDCCGNSR